MLYATTRSKLDTYTNLWAIRDDTAPDGGLFVPVQVPKFSDGEIRSLAQLTAADAVALVLNRFFSCSLNGRQIEFSLGRNLYHLTDISHRITVAELWRGADFQRTLEVLTRLAAPDHGISRPSQWMGIAARVGILFAIFGQLQRDGVVGLRRPMDVAVELGDFSGPMAAWYARRMGLPIGTIVCCCNENGAVWDLLRRGQFRTNVPKIDTITPACDNPVPQGLERLIYAALGPEEVLEFNRVCSRGGIYEVNPEQHRRLREGMYASVVSSTRLLGAIPNVYRTHGCLLDPYGALSYSGLMDYRAMSRESRPAVLLCQRNPIQSGAVVEDALGMTQKELRGVLGLS